MKTKSERKMKEKIKSKTISDEMNIKKAKGRDEFLNDFLFIYFFFFISFLFFYSSFFPLAFGFYL